MPTGAKRWWQRKFFARTRAPMWFVDMLILMECEQFALGNGADGARASTTWLLRYRPQLRRVDEVLPMPLHMYLRSCPESMQPIGIWLLGRMATRTEHFGLFERALDSPPAGRRHAARALRRIEAWEKLRTLAQLNPDDAKIAWYAHAPTTKRDFGQRLRNFAAHVDGSHASDANGPSRMALWFADLDWIRRAPKPAEIIRRILDRIHRLVHGAK
jgi:hypothetical protein